MWRGEFIGLAMASLLVFPGTVWGQTIPERLGTLERKFEEQQKDLAGLLGVDIHGLVAVDYMYSINNPDSHEAQLRVFDTDANSFTLNQANLRVSREREKEDFGFAINMDFGKTAEVVGGATCWDRGCDSSENDNSFELREAYLTYTAPIGDGVTFKAGKFVTSHGTEVIKDYNALNYSVSNSLLFGFAVPFTHTGIMASFPLGPYLSADVGVVNGWDDVVDQNDGKSLHAAFKIEPIDTLSISVSGTYGPEQPDNGKSKRALVTTLLAFDPREELTFLLEADWGNESDLLPHREPGPGLRSADWYGFAGYVIVRPIERLSLALRAEVFDDADGVRTGIDVGGFAPGVTVWELTPSVSYQLTKGLLARVEYRHDEADRSVFDNGDHTQNGQDTIAAELLYAF